MTTKANTRYIEAVGRRKTAVARVRITEGAKNAFVINEKPVADFFPTEEMRIVAQEALTKTEVAAKFHVSAHVKGGGSHAQAEAVRHGLARALVDFDADLRTGLKKAGYLKRDPRSVERKKPGLKKARKAPQWSKR